MDHGQLGQGFILETMRDFLIINHTLKHTYVCERRDVESCVVTCRLTFGRYFFRCLIINMLTCENTFIPIKYTYTAKTDHQYTAQVLYLPNPNPNIGT